MLHFLQKFLFLVENRLQDLREEYEKTGNQTIKTAITLNINIRNTIKGLIDDINRK